ncbi:hypothetical protein I0C86_04560 [Plantactinospora sp. S1510]|uniref:Lipoprotein n=1 Tax=Plantactinospora alkalitolerans TaxID=2789879 RepID=A0ABS0GPY9_9ACTN|nr:hypothetical protein [Plantactinospora alkalitolerans]MBF9128270.1 hypothetical protein [Plantactinospora alkalitolerans]
MTVVRLRAQRRTIGLALGLAGLAVAVPGCGGQDPSDTASPAPTTAAATSAAPPITPSATPVSTDGCPVDPTTLFAALQANRKLSSALDARISGVRDAACHRGYATAVSVVPPELADPAFIAFRYDRGSGTWKAIAAGTDGICGELVPADIIPELSGCVGS